MERNFSKRRFTNIVVISFSLFILACGSSKETTKASASPSQQPMQVSEDFEWPTNLGKPQLLHKEAPVYPKEAKESGAAGQVIVMVTVSEEGKPIATKILKSVHPALDEAAADAAMKSKYKAATQNGKPVRAIIAIPYSFSQ